MSLRSRLRLLAPANLRSAWSLRRRADEAGRILRGAAPSAAPPVGPPRPYDHRVTCRLRRGARLLGRGEANPTTVIAAWLELRDTGWPCSVEIGKAEGRPAACLRMWGEPVLGTAPPAFAPERCYEAGIPVRETEPRLPARTTERVAQVSCSGSLAEGLQGLLEPLGGLGAVVRPGDSVLIKPNFNSYHPPPASTALDLASCVVAMLRDVGAARVAVGECSANWLSPTRSVVTRAGLTEWARQERVELVLFDEEPWRACPIAAGHWPHVLVPEALTRFDRLIYLVSAKTHRVAGASLSLKLGVGLMHPVQRAALHATDLPERIAEIALAVQPDLAIVDARLCFVTRGPDVGATRAPGLLLAGTDLAALDSAALAVLKAHGAAGLAGAEEQIGAARRVIGGNPTPEEGVSEGCGELASSRLSNTGGSSDAQTIPEAKACSTGTTQGHYGSAHTDLAAEPSTARTNDTRGACR